MQEENPKRMQMYRLTEAGRAATNQTVKSKNFNSNWEKVPMLKNELTFYRYTNSHISNNEKWINRVQQELGVHQFYVDRLPVDTPYEMDDYGNIKSVEREPYNINMSEESQWNYNTFTDERKFRLHLRWKLWNLY